MREYINRIYNMDCLAGMSMYPDKSIDMILCDLPYGITDCRWDSLLPFPELWRQYCRIIKDNGCADILPALHNAANLKQHKNVSILLVLV